MNRDYSDGVKQNVTFFVGTEIEHTPAHGMKTLFVVGVQPVDLIMSHAKAYDVEHIYLGANQSFEPTVEWDNMIKQLIDLCRLVTLDFDVKHVEWVLESGYTESRYFIPQVSVKIPYISQLGYLATLKIDDKGFAASNPGVWCHSIHELQAKDKFTSWDSYKKDKTI